MPLKSCSVTHSRPESIVSGCRPGSRPRNTRPSVRGTPVGTYLPRKTRQSVPHMTDTVRSRCSCTVLSSSLRSTYTQRTQHNSKRQQLVRAPRQQRARTRRARTQTPNHTHSRRGRRRRGTLTHGHALHAFRVRAILTARKLALLVASGCIGLAIVANGRWAARTTTRRHYLRTRKRNERKQNNECSHRRCSRQRRASINYRAYLVAAVTVPHSARESLVYAR